MQKNGCRFGLRASTVTLFAFQQRDIAVEVERPVVPATVFEYPVPQTSQRELGRLQGSPQRSSLLASSFERRADLLSPSRGSPPERIKIFLAVSTCAAVRQSAASPPLHWIT